MFLTDIIIATKLFPRVAHIYISQINQAKLHK